MTASASEPAWAAEALAAGWLPPGEAEFRLWRAANMNRDSCRWCGAVRDRPGCDPRPHRAACRFYDGPVKHAFANGHYGSFDFWITCTCGRDYPEHDASGSKQECPDREMTHRHPRERDLLAERLTAGTGGGE